MSTLLDVRKQLVRHSGRYDLVVDAEGGDWSDNGADLFINAGQKYLDRQLPYHKAQAWLYKSIAAGTAQLTFKRARLVKEVWVVRDSSRTQLTRRTLRDLRTLYPTVPLASIDTGAPLYWTPGVTRMAPEQHDSYEEHIANKSFDTDDGWDTDAGNTAVDAADSNSVEFKADLSFYTQYVEQVEANQAVPLEVGRSYRVRVNGTYANGILTGMNPLVCLGTNKVSLGIDTSAGASGTIAFDQVMECQGTTTFRIENDSAATTFFNAEITDVSVTSVLDADLEDVDFLLFGERDLLRDLIILPPPDGTITVEVLADWYSPELSADTDQSFWTVEEPLLLERAARMQMEVDLHRNSQGRADFANPLREELLEIYFDLVGEEQAGPADQWVLNG